MMEFLKSSFFWYFLGEMYETKRLTENHILMGHQYQSSTQGLVKGAKLCLNPNFFGWLEK